MLQRAAAALVVVVQQAVRVVLVDLVEMEELAKQG